MIEVLRVKGLPHPELRRPYFEERAKAYGGTNREDFFDAAATHVIARRGSEIVGGIRIGPVKQAREWPSAETLPGLPEHSDIAAASRLFVRQSLSEDERREVRNALLAEAAAVVHQEGKTHVLASVKEGNPSLHDWYLRMGFRDTGRTFQNPDFGNAPHRILLMPFTPEVLNGLRKKTVLGRARQARAVA